MPPWQMSALSLPILISPSVRIRGQPLSKYQSLHASDLNTPAIPHLRLTGPMQIPPPKLPSLPPLKVQIPLP
jgi:hypothetical protein